jgi:hypothetical protein
MYFEVLSFIREEPIAIFIFKEGLCSAVRHLWGDAMFR